MSRVIVLAVLGVAISFLLVSTVSADPSRGPVPAATFAATEWLAAVDAGDYEGSWQAAAPYFQRAVDRAHWVKTLEAVRRPLGSVGKRTLADAQYTKHLPGAPDGAYVVLRFVTTFEHKAHSMETVTSMRIEDGTWRVSGYFIR